MKFYYFSANEWELVAKQSTLRLLKEFSNDVLKRDFLKPTKQLRAQSPDTSNRSQILNTVGDHVRSSGNALVKTTLKRCVFN